MVHPVVTIIITVFRRASYLRQAIDSAVAQTFQNLEIIVSDDSDSEEVKAVCRKFAGDHRVRYRSNRDRIGVALNVGAAFAESRGEYIAIVNDDDVMESFMIERLLAPLLENPSCVVSFGDHWMMTSGGNLERQLTEYNSAVRGRSKLKAGVIESPASFAIRGGVSVVMGALFRRSACRIEWFREQVEGAYDYWLAVKLAFAGPFFFVMERVMRYRIHGASESGKIYPDKAMGEVFVYDALLGDDLQLHDRLFIKRQLEHQLFVLGRDRLYFGNSCSARDAFRQSLRYGFSVRASMGMILTSLPVAVRRCVLRGWRAVRGIRAHLPDSA